MFTIQQTQQFREWLAGLSDRTAKAAILRRIERAQGGLLGDVEPVGGDVSEMRVHVGAGYRVYFTKRDGVLIVLLVGGSKKTQAADIRRARELSANIE